MLNFVSFSKIALLLIGLTLVTGCAEPSLEIGPPPPKSPLSSFCSIDGVCTKTAPLGITNFTAIYGRSDADMWVGGEYGVLWHYNGHQWVLTHRDPQLTWIGIHAISEQRAWAIGSNNTDKTLALYRWNGLRWFPYQGPCLDAPQTFCNATDISKGLSKDTWILKGQGDNVWLVSNNGVFLHLENDQWNTKLQPDKGPKDKIQALWVDKSGRVWAAGPNNLVGYVDPTSLNWVPITLKVSVTPSWQFLAGDDEADGMYVADAEGNMAFSHLKDKTQSSAWIQVKITKATGLQAFQLGAHGQVWMLSKVGQSNTLIQCTDTNTCKDVPNVLPVNALLFAQRHLDSLWVIGPNGLLLEEQPQNTTNPSINHNPVQGWDKQTANPIKPNPESFDIITEHWIVGSNNTILRRPTISPASLDIPHSPAWDWQVVYPGRALPGQIRAVAEGGADDDVWMLGDYGFILQHNLKWNPNDFKLINLDGKGLRAIWTAPGKDYLLITGDDTIRCTNIKVSPLCKKLPNFGHYLLGITFDPVKNLVLATGLYGGKTATIFTYDETSNEFTAIKSSAGANFGPPFILPLEGGTTRLYVPQSPLSSAKSLYYVDITRENIFLALTEDTDWNAADNILHIWNDRNIVWARTQTGLYKKDLSAAMPSWQKIGSYMNGLLSSVFVDQKKVLWQGNSDGTLFKIQDAVTPNGGYSGQGSFFPSMSPKAMLVGNSQETLYAVDASLFARYSPANWSDISKPPARSDFWGSVALAEDGTLATTALSGTETTLQVKRGQDATIRIFPKNTPVQSLAWNKTDLWGSSSHGRLFLWDSDSGYANPGKLIQCPTTAYLQNVTALKDGLDYVWAAGENVLVRASRAGCALVQTLPSDFNTRAIASYRTEPLKTMVLVLGQNSLRVYQQTANGISRKVDLTPLEKYPLFNAVWARSSSDIWIVGDQGTLLHYDGGSWKKMDAGTSRNLLSIWGDALGNVWILGEQGTLLQRQTTKP